MSARAAVNGGAGWLVVATLDEATVLGAAGVDVPILAFYPVPRASLEAAAMLRLDVVLGNGDSIDDVAAAAAADPASPPFAFTRRSTAGPAHCSAGRGSARLPVAGQRLCPPSGQRFCHQRRSR